MAESLVLSDGTRTFDLLGDSALIYVRDGGLVLPVVSNENTYAEGSDSEGRSRARFRPTNSEAGSITVYFRGTTNALFRDAIDNLQELVVSANLNKGTLAYTPPNGVAVTYDLESIQITDMPQDGVALKNRNAEATISFETKPYGRLASQSYPLIGSGNSYSKLVLTPLYSTAMLLPLGVSAGGTDLTTNARNGTAAGGVTIGGIAANSGPLVRSDAGATDFDGTDDRITTAYNPFTNSTSRTYMGWAKRDTSSSVDTIFGGSVASPAVLQLSSGSQNVVFKPQNSTTTTWTSAWPGNGVWVHWALVFNETTNDVSLYINGALVSAQTNAQAYNGTPGNFQLGTYNSTTDPFDGKMAYVSVHTAALSASLIDVAYDAGASAAGSTITALAGPIDYFEIDSVPGQVSALPEFRFSDMVPISRNIVEVGVQNEFDPNAAENLRLDLAAGLTALGGASNTRAGSVATNIIRAALATTEISVCKAASQTHKGLWKVRARVYPSATTVLVRLAWRTGDGPFAKEKWVAVPGSAAWFDLDLGTVNIKELPSGHTCEFRVEAKTTSGNPTVDVDIVECMPADSYTKLRGSTSAETGSGAIVAMDDFSTQTAGAVTGKTPLLAPAGLYSGAGDADDFQVDTTNQRIYRSAVSDSAANNGRYLRCGSGTLAATSVSADVLPTYSNASFERLGIFLRYVDVSNWLMCSYSYFFSSVTVTLKKRVAATETTLGTYTAAYTSGWRTLTCSADTSGNVLVYEGPQGGVATPVILTLADANLATAGAIASGGYGIYDATTSSLTATRYYDNFLVSTLATSASIANPAMNANYGVTLKHNTSLTDNSAGTNLSVTPIRQGNYPKIPPATRNGLKSRVVVRARRDDNDLGLADSGTSDTMTASLTVTPRVHLTGT